MHEHEGEMTLSKITMLLGIMTDGLKHATEQGLANLDTHEAGEVADIIKDLSEAEKNEWESCYYKKILEAMESSEADRYGYIPPEMTRMGRQGRQRENIKRWVRDPDMFEQDLEDRMGYTPNWRRIPSSQSYDTEHDNRYGKPYREYLDSRRHYTETKSQVDKDAMDMHANEHLMDVMNTIREIYKGADPDQRKRMKSDLTKLVGEMPT